MASEVEICNLALAHLGDSATIASIDPPEGSAQAEHCSRFYPMARDALLQTHPWNFATRRAQLAQLANAPYGWAFTYARPVGALDVFDIQPPNVVDGTEPTKAYVCELDAEGNEVIYTNVQNAVARYVTLVTDTNRFSPLFTLALSWHLASMLAGPIIKGKEGAAQAQRCAQMAEMYLSRAKVNDAQQRHIDATHNATGIVGSDRIPLTGVWGR